MDTFHSNLVSLVCVCFIFPFVCTCSGTLYIGDRTKKHFSPTKHFQKQISKKKFLIIQDNHNDNNDDDSSGVGSGGGGDVDYNHSMILVCLLCYRIDSHIT